MRVAEEQVPDIAVPRDNVGDCLLIGEPDPVETGQVQIERRMMHEQINRFVIQAVQGLSQPGLPRGAEDTAMGSRLNRVEQDEFTGAGIDHRLYESLCVGGRAGKVREEAISTVMVADQQVAGQFKARQAPGKPGVSACVSEISQVTGYHAAFGVGVKPGDIREGRFEPGNGIEALELVPGCDQVRVGEVDEFNAAYLGNRKALYRF
jgi:hypothetical protein